METMETQVDVGGEVVNLWLPLIYRALLHYRVRESDKDDVAQEIVCQIIEKKYHQIYDPEKSELSTFVFAMVRKRIKSLFARKGRDALKRSQLIGDDEWIIEDRPCSECVLKDVEKKEFWGLVDEARKELDKLPRRRPRIKDGKVQVRTVTEVFNMMVDGLNQSSIATEMGYSEGSVSIMVGMIRKQPAVQKLLFYQKI